ncbi:MAG: hypothetical protein JXB08_02180 [Bacilli bacterium]|nr:hypothetical protein [Bacilli bacterium]MBN2876170.1 hypothetical protein [Bacilli bacterium]
MKKILLSCLFLLLLISCRSYSPDDFHVKSDNLVDGFWIYEYEQEGLFCNTYYEDIFYSGEVYNYGYSYIGCDPSMTYFILYQDEYIYLQDALDMGLISLASLIPELDTIERHPETISTEEADYYWLDFHIDHSVVYAYAGGVCDLEASETFVINDENYQYTASGCLQEHILFMEIQGDYVPISELLEDGTIDGDLLIPLLDKV